jgi:tRNA 2-selenouridine synthase SelU
MNDFIKIVKQNKIAEHIEAIRDESTTLKKEAKEVLEEAKMEVEQIILGEET